MTDPAFAHPPIQPPTHPTRAVFARHAASLLVIRETPTGPAILMGLRSQGHRFMPNRLVFPGGAVDPTDATAPAEAEPDPALLAALGHRTPPRLARAIVHCAARELEEETGLTLRRTPGAPPRLDGIEYLCRAVTPPRSPIRFNARFLVVPESRLHGTLHDSAELGALAYRPIDDALAEDLAPVTAEILRHYRARSTGPQTGPQAGNRSVYRHQRWRLER